MFSLWVCPDCRRVGRRGGAAPGLALPGGLSPDGDETHRPGGMAIVISSWTCPECGQAGELIESRETVVEEVAPGVLREVRRDPLFIDHRDRNIRPAAFVIGAFVIALLLEGLFLLNAFGH